VRSSPEPADSDSASQVKPTPSRAGAAPSSGPREKKPATNPSPASSAPSKRHLRFDSNTSRNSPANAADVAASSVMSPNSVRAECA
jgi:hypothetical protein